MIFSIEQENSHIVIKIFRIKINLKFKQKSQNNNIQSELGEYSYSGAKFISPNTEIGKYCSIATGVIIGPDIHPVNFITTSPKLYDDNSIERFPKIIIGNDVWIGANAICFPNGGGVIGDGSIIAAGAVVTHDVPPYAIVAGVPAKIIKYRFNETIRTKLLKSKWWDISFDTLKNFDIKDVNKFLEQVEVYNEK